MPHSRQETQLLQHAVSGWRYGLMGSSLGALLSIHVLTLNPVEHSQRQHP